MAKISLKQIQAFVTVADLGSFRRAAEKLLTTQPNISSRISGLEVQLGAKLMERDAGSVRMTATGELLLPRARDVLAALDAFLVAADNNSLFDGVLRLGVTEVIVHSWLGAFVAQLKQQYPNLDVELTVDFSANLSEALFNHSIDLAFQSGPFSQQTSGNVELASYPLVWMAAPKLGLDRPALALADLAAHSILTHARGTLPFEQLRAHMQAMPENSARLVPSTNMAACLQMTRDGLGVACLPEVMVREDLKSGTLIAADYPWSPEPLCFSARYDRRSSPAFVHDAATLAQKIAHGFEHAAQ